ncbi:uncharacterized protein LOC118192733 isoform X2 [Stegodyphus dumicola]|uniref:uncharacterized protein LOC118192733 isoform X2 n=1 Tax=Stegodyphus dumicola TaxID=202533 RepID=UPI0015A83DD0|nr:uncharacterized protein LOC118192733 isoform X2 [Stegodyphus dumicola]
MPSTIPVSVDMAKEDEANRKGKENKKPSNPEMNPKDEISPPVLNKNTVSEDTVKEDTLSLPLLPGTPEMPSKCSNSSENRKRSPVRFPTLLIPGPDKVSNPRPTVAGILFLPSIL